MGKKPEKDSLLVKVVQPDEPKMPSMDILKRAAEAAKGTKVAPNEAGVAHGNAWAAYRHSVTRPADYKPLSARFQAAPPALHVAPLSRRESRPLLGYVRLRAVDSFELVNHVLANGELMEAKVKKFSSLEAAYEELMLQVMAQREKALKALADYKAQVAERGES